MGHTTGPCDCCGGGSSSFENPCLPNGCVVSLYTWYIHFPQVGGMSGCCDKFDGQVVPVNYLCRNSNLACIWQSDDMDGCVVQLALSGHLSVGYPAAVVSIIREPGPTIANSSGVCESGGSGAGIQDAIWQEQDFGNNKPGFECLGDNTIPWFGEQLGSSSPTDCDEFIDTNVIMSPNP